MNARTFLVPLLVAAAVPLAAAAGDTATCEGKRGWQREVVRDSVHRWFAGDPRPDDLLELIQAEQGVVACRTTDGRPLRLHTTALTRGLQVDQLGAVLLANELEWSGLVEPPEEALAGKWFEVVGREPEGSAAE